MIPTLLRRVFAMACLVIMGAAVVNASIPARNFYYVRIDAVKNEAKLLPDADLDGLAGKLVAGKNEEGPRSALAGKEYLAVRETDLIDGLIALIRPSLKKGHRKEVDLFLKKLADRRLVRGFQVAERGGPFVSAARLQAGKSGGVSFVLENLHEEDGRRLFALSTEVVPDTRR